MVGLLPWRSAAVEAVSAACSALRRESWDVAKSVGDKDVAGAMVI